MELKRTSINAMKDWESIEVVLSDDPDEAKAKEYISFKVAVQAQGNRPLAEAQLAALRRARSLLSVEMQRIENLLDN